MGYQTNPCSGKEPSRATKRASPASGLFFNGTSLPVAQLGPDFLLLDSATDHPPCDASIVLRVDQSERRWKLRLPRGISASSRRVAIAPAV